MEAYSDVLYLNDLLVIEIEDIESSNQDTTEDE